MDDVTPPSPEPDPTLRDLPAAPPPPPPPPPAAPSAAPAPGVWSDGLRLAVGTLTVVPTPPPSRVDRDVARAGALLAPVAALPLGLAVTAVLLIGNLAETPAFLTGLIAVATLALLTRGLHLDGLSDTVDGLSASYDRARALEVMRRGDVGPSGAVALVVVLGLQATAFGLLSTADAGALLAGVAVVVSRWAVPSACAAGVPAARPDGLGAAMAGTVPAVRVVLGWCVAVGLVAATAAIADVPGIDALRGAAAVVVGAAALALLLRRAAARLGGVTGDVFGAGVETALTAVLVTLLV